LKWLNLERIFSIHHQLPIGQQLFLMEFSPGQYEFGLPAREITVDDLARADVHCCLILTVVGMKMRRRMLAWAKYIRMMIPKNIDMVGIYFPFLFNL
jgi:hypothetical protein